MVMASDDLPYPNLVTCRVVLQGTKGVDKPPVRLTPDCLQAAEPLRLRPVYNFELGKVYHHHHTGDHTTTRLWVLDSRLID